jgi:hypothetical protein
VSLYAYIILLSDYFFFLHIMTRQGQMPWRENEVSLINWMVCLHVTNIVTALLVSPNEAKK